MDEIKIVITDHSRERIIERVGCRPNKVQQIAAKAWLYGTEPSEWFMGRRKIHKHNEKSVYKVWMGVAFVFVVDQFPTVIITTVLQYQPKSYPNGSPVTTK